MTQYIGHMDRSPDGFTSVSRMVESYMPKDRQVWDRYVQLVSEGRIAEACRIHTERLAEAMVTDDLPIVLGGSVDTHVYEAFETVSQNWRIPFRTANFTNFREQNVAVLEDLETDSQDSSRTLSGTIPMVPEQHGYDDARIDEEYENAELETYGVIFQYTRQMLFNDDQRRMQRLPAAMGTAMGRTINKHVADALEASASTTTSGMTMRDGSRLFNTVAPAGSLINMWSDALPLNRANIMTAMVYFANLTTPQGRIMNLRPKYLIVPPELQYQAEYLTGVSADGMRLIGGTTAAAIAPDNVYPLPILTPVYLEELTSAVDWYLAADPAEFPTVEVGFLNGRETPELFTKNETGLDLHSSDGVQYKIRHDFDVFTVSRRGILKIDDTT